MVPVVSISHPQNRRAKDIKSESIIQTKLHRPPIHREHLHREHLLEKLNRRRTPPLVLVSAPAGYGKSTLVSCWLKACDSPGAWVSLDRHDNDLRQLLTYFIAAIQSLFPTACRQTQSMLKASHLPPVAVLSRSLTNELEQLETPFIMVLDDYHHMRKKDIQEFITNLLAYPSNNMQLVLISRRDPPLPLTSLRAKRKMIEIRTRDLCFSSGEIEFFLKKVAGLSISKSDAAILERRTEGWVTGLQLAVLSLRQSKDFSRIIKDLPVENRYVMDYIVTEILANQPQSIQACMLKTAVLDRFCMPLCKAVCISSQATVDRDLQGRKFLEYLDKANLFVIPLDDKREWFRYHHLFQSLLKRQLAKRFKKEDITQLYRKASVWFAENGHMEEALTHALESGDHTAAAQVIEQHRHTIMNQEQWYNLNRWLNLFPPAFILGHPDLLLARAWTLQRQARYSELFDILEGLEPVEPPGSPAPDTDNVYWGEIQALKSFQHYTASRPERSEASAREALARLPDRYHSVRGFALIILAIALQMRGDPLQARREIYAAMQQTEAVIPVYKTMLLAALCYTSWIAADLDNLLQAAGQLIQHGQKQDLPETTVVGQFFSGIAHYQRNDLDQAERYLVSVVNAPPGGELAIPSLVTYSQSAFALALTYQATGHAEKARETIAAVIAYMLETGNSELLEICRAFQADLFLRQGYAAKAAFWARDRISGPLVPAYRFYTPDLTLPRILLSGRTVESLAEAYKLLARLNDYYLSIHNTRGLIDVIVLQAMHHAARDDQSAACEKLVTALTLAEPGGSVRPFLDLGPEMERCLERLAEHKPELAFVRLILAAFESQKSCVATDPSDSGQKSESETPDERRIDPLTNREIEVLKTLATGVSNKGIAARLYISPETVKRHLSTIYGKLGVKNRHQAIAAARSIGIL